MNDNLIEMQASDPRVGEYAPSGEVVRYPTHDLMGTPVIQGRGAMTTRRIQDKYFVCVPSAFTRSHVEIRIVEPKVGKPYANPAPDA